MKLRGGCLAAIFLMAPGLAPAQGPREISIVTGRGELLQFERDIERVAISEPKIADAIVVSPREIMVNGKSAGKASLIVWDGGSAPSRYNINVATTTLDSANARTFSSFTRGGGMGLPEMTGSPNLEPLKSTKSAKEFAIARSLKDQPLP